MAQSVCILCSAVLSDHVARRAHIASVHPGYSIGWEGRLPKITAPDGTSRVMGQYEFRKLRTDALAGRGPKASRRFEDVTAGAVADDPITGDPGSPPTPAANPRPAFVNQAPIRPTTNATQASVRDAVRDSLDVQMLAKIIQDFSKTLSEADGAGEAGVLSGSQSAQIATLVYDETITFIVNRFGGNVGRFKLALAAGIIVLSKGRIHAVAIMARVEDQRANRARVVGPPPEADDWQGASAGPVDDDVVTFEPATDEPIIEPSQDPRDAIRELAERQARAKAGA